MDSSGKKNMGYRFVFKDSMQLHLPFSLAAYDLPLLNYQCLTFLTNGLNRRINVLCS